MISSAAPIRSSTFYACLITKIGNRNFRRVASSVFEKIYKLHTEKLLELEATVVDKLTFFIITFICKFYVLAIPCIFITTC